MTNYGPGRLEIYLCARNRALHTGTPKPLGRRSRREAGVEGRCAGLLPIYAQLNGWLFWIAPPENEILPVRAGRNPCCAWSKSSRWLDDICALCAQSSRGLSPPLTPPYVPFMAYGGFTASDWSRNLEFLPQLFYLSSPDTLSTPPHRLRGFGLAPLSIPQSRPRTFQYFLALLL